MKLGDVTKKTARRMSLVSPARQDGALSTRAHIPHRGHEAIDVLCAVSVAIARFLVNARLVTSKYAQSRSGPFERGGLRFRALVDGRSRQEIRSVDA